MWATQQICCAGGQPTRLGLLIRLPSVHIFPSCARRPTRYFFQMSQGMHAKVIVITFCDEVGVDP